MTNVLRVFCAFILAGAGCSPVQYTVQKRNNLPPVDDERPVNSESFFNATARLTLVDSNCAPGSTPLEIDLTQAQCTEFARRDVSVAETTYSKQPKRNTIALFASSAIVLGFGIGTVVAPDTIGSGTDKGGKIALFSISGILALFGLGSLAAPKLVAERQFVEPHETVVKTTCSPSVAGQRLFMSYGACWNPPLAAVTNAAGVARFCIPEERLQDVWMLGRATVRTERFKVGEVALDRLVGSSLSPNQRKFLAGIDCLTPYARNKACKDRPRDAFGDFTQMFCEEKLQIERTCSPSLAPVAREIARIAQKARRKDSDETALEELIRRTLGYLGEGAIDAYCVKNESDPGSILFQ